MDRFVTIFKALSDPTRLRILRLLLRAKGALCVCELVDSLEAPQYNISKHLQELKDAGLIHSRKEGRWVYYEVVPAGPAFTRLVTDAVAAIPDAETKRDMAELRKRLRLREGGKCLLGVQKGELLSTAKPQASR